MTDGSKANVTGKVLELAVEDLLSRKGYEDPTKVVPKRGRLEALRASPLTRKYAKQVYIGKSIYGTDLYADFLISKDGEETILECRWQQVSGSVDEKFPYMDLNIRERFPCPAIVIADGKGCKPGAMAWLRNRVPEDPNLKAVYDLAEFIRFANDWL